MRIDIDKARATAKELESAPAYATAELGSKAPSRVRPPGSQDDEITALRTELAEARREAEALRRLLWLQHGHSGLYGDDDEMQCATCVRDYKRDSVDLLEDGFIRLAMKRAKADAATRSAPQGEPTGTADDEIAPAVIAELAKTHTTSDEWINDKIRQAGEPTGQPVEKFNSAGEI